MYNQLIPTVRISLAYIATTDETDSQLLWKKRVGTELELSIIVKDTAMAHTILCPCMCKLILVVIETPICKTMRDNGIVKAVSCSPYTPDCHEQFHINKSFTHMHVAAKVVELLKLCSYL